MTELAIFLYGLVVTAIVGGAIWLIVWGIIEERHDRETLDAGPEARPSDGEAAATESSGKTVESRRTAR